jgi:hypothetical protein
MTSLLARLQRDISELEVESILPNSLFLRRVSAEQFELLDVALMSEENDLGNDPKMKTITTQSTFRKNPIAVLIPLAEVIEEEKAISQDANGEEREVSDDEWMDINHQENEEEEEETENIEEVDLQEFPFSDQDRIYYSLHINFGNEELDSAVRIKMAFPICMETLIEDLRLNKALSSTISFESIAKEHPAPKGVTKNIWNEQILFILKLLTYHGYLHLKEKN